MDVITELDVAVAVVGDACAAVEGVRAADLWRLSGRELLDLSVAVERLSRLVFATQVSVAGELDTQKAAADHGCMSTAALLRQTLAISAADAKNRVDTAQAVLPRESLTGGEIPPVLPLLGEALAAGAIGVEQTRTIVALMNQIPAAVDDSTRNLCQKHLVENGILTEPKPFAAFARAVIGTITEDEEPDEDRSRRIELFLGRRNPATGMTRFHGQLDDLGVEVVSQAIDALAKPRPATSAAGSDAAAATDSAVANDSGAGTDVDAGGFAGTETADGGGSARAGGRDAAVPDATADCDDACGEGDGSAECSPGAPGSADSPNTAGHPGSARSPGASGEDEAAGSPGASGAADSAGSSGASGAADSPNTAGHPDSAGSPGASGAADSPNTAGHPGSAGSSGGSGEHAAGSTNEAFPDSRSAACRRGQALIEALRRFLDQGTAPIQGGQRPHITVTIGLDELRRGVGTGCLDFGGPLSAGALRMLACDAAIIPAVLGGPSQVLDVGRANRLFPPGIRKAIALRDKGCAFPGCDRPPGWTEAHHIRHWIHGGRRVWTTACCCVPAIITRSTAVTGKSGWRPMVCRNSCRLNGSTRNENPDATPPTTFPPCLEWEEGCDSRPCSQDADLPAAAVGSDRWSTAGAEWARRANGTPGEFNQTRLTGSCDREPQPGIRGAHGSPAELGGRVSTPTQN